MLHSHVTGWTITLILFIICAMKLRTGQPPKALHMILRLMYIIVLVTGSHLLFAVWQMAPMAIVKGLVGLWVISTMEMTLVRGTKGKPIKGSIIQFVIALILVFILGYGVLG
ncbi:hypothetical protein BFG57_04650 [Bacillus solimangrovi]|uniref:Uncharacterized protein n=2 Tax=Bacillus solimangrovi TaxID=1305675 RepID=A0A1E5LC93_9BACI|nr:hypothetical protein BFG57_04650 [Bacillus solimangrovi]